MKFAKFVFLYISRIFPTVWMDFYNISGMDSPWNRTVILCEQFPPKRVFHMPLIFDSMSSPEQCWIYLSDVGFAVLLWSVTWVLPVTYRLVKLNDLNYHVPGLICFRDAQNRQAYFDHFVVGHSVSVHGELDGWRAEEGIKDGVQEWYTVWHYQCTQVPCFTCSEAGRENQESRDV